MPDSITGEQNSGSSSNKKESGQLYLEVGARVLSGWKGVNYLTSDGIMLKYI